MERKLFHPNPQTGMPLLTPFQIKCPSNSIISSVPPAAFGANPGHCQLAATVAAGPAAVVLLPILPVAEAWKAMLESCLLPLLWAGPGWRPALRLLARAGGHPTPLQESLPAPFPPSSSSSSGNSPGLAPRPPLGLSVPAPPFLLPLHPPGLQQPCPGPHGTGSSTQGGKRVLASSSEERHEGKTA